MPDAAVTASLETLLRETRRFPPPSSFAEKARVSSPAEYERLYKRSHEDPESFWAEIARELSWNAPWRQVLDWKPPHAKWFVGARTNLSWNCLDRHLTTWRKNKAAIVWEGEPGETRTLTYVQLHREVARFASALLKLGIKAGDRVAIYMPMVPEAAVAMLACARIGAVHSVVFGGFSSQAL